MTQIQHEMDIRIYYEDTDAGGIVFYANYLKFCERGRTEFLRQAGLESKPLMDREGFIFVVRKLTADYLLPAFLDDIIVMKTTLTEMRNASFDMKQIIYKKADGGQPNIKIFEMDVTLVCVNKKGKPIRVSDPVRDALGL
jgi:acyl-CoA thioester hydrolase